MVFGDKVVAAVKPDAEAAVVTGEDEGGDDEEEEEEEEADFGEDCFCICFCDGDDDDDDADGTEIEKKDDSERTPGQEDEEEPELIDPQDELREQCAQKKDCASLKERLEQCNARVESRSKTAETCVEEVIDFMHCVDHCASKTLFSKLK